MFTISKSFRFEAAHALDFLPATHKCHAVHGHSYKVELVSAREVLDNDKNWVHDFADFDRFADYLKDQCDHKNLNTVFGGGHYTTAERLAGQFFETARMLGLSDVVEVRVYETEKTCAVFREDAWSKTCDALDEEAGFKEPAKIDVEQLRAGARAVIRNELEAIRMLREDRKRYEQRAKAREHQPPHRSKFLTPLGDVLTEFADIEKFERGPRFDGVTLEMHYPQLRRALFRLRAESDKHGYVNSDRYGHEVDRLVSAFKRLTRRERLVLEAASLPVFRALDALVVKHDER